MFWLLVPEGGRIVSDVLAGEGPTNIGRASPAVRAGGSAFTFREATEENDGNETMNRNQEQGCSQFEPRLDTVRDGGYREVETEDREYALGLYQTEIIEELRGYPHFSEDRGWF